MQFQDQICVPFAKWYSPKEDSLFVHTQKSLAEMYMKLTLTLFLQFPCYTYIENYLYTSTIKQHLLLVRFMVNATYLTIKPHVKKQLLLF